MEGISGPVETVHRDKRNAILLRAIADDIELLAILHDREPTAALLSALKACPVAEQLSLRLKSDEAVAALAAMEQALAELDDPAEATTLDALAVDYADVYLRHSYRASPTESVWMTEDGLERQGPMLAIRAVHRSHGVIMADPEKRTEDHLVAQLRFVAHLLGGEAGEDGAHAAARFLDQHLLRWLRLFASRLVQTEAPAYFTALALLTACHLDEARELLAGITGVPRQVAPIEVGRGRERAPSCGDPPNFVPGLAPSW